MGEMIVGAKRGNLPLVLIRPTIITSTIKEPFPGWTEGIRLEHRVSLQHIKNIYTLFCIFFVHVLNQITVATSKATLKAENIS